MTTILNTPYIMTDLLLQIAADNYEQAASRVEFKPAVEQKTFQGGTPAAAFVAQTTAKWTLQLDYAQDWKTTNSLAQYLLANAGQTKTIIFKPKGATTLEAIITASVIIAPGPIGGPVDDIQLASVTMGVIGQPVKTANP